MLKPCKTEFHNPTFQRTDKDLPYDLEFKFFYHIGKGILIILSLRSLTIQLCKAEINFEEKITK